MSERLWKILDIRTEANWFAKPLFLHFFFQGITWAMLYTVAVSVFLGNLPYQRLPLFYLLTAASLLVTGRIFASLEYYLPLNKLLKTVSIIFVVMAGGLFLFFDWKLTVWFSFLILIVSRQFFLLKGLSTWSLSSHLLNTMPNQRKLEWLMNGDLPGRFLGYVLASGLLYWGSLKFLIAIAFIASAMSLIYVRRITENVQFNPNGEGYVGKISFKDELKELKRFFSYRLVMPLTALTFFVSASSVLIDFTFLSATSLNYRGDVEIARFIALFFSLASAVMLLLRFLALSQKITALGVRRKLLLLPFVLLIPALYLWASGSGVFGWPVLLVFLLISLRTTFHDPLFMTLLHPLANNLKFRGYTIMYGLVAPIAIGMVGLYLLLVSPVSFGEFSLIWTSLLILVVAWLTLIVYSKKTFLQILQTAVDVRTLKGSLIAVRDRHIMEMLEKKLTSTHSEEVIYSIELLQRFEVKNIQERLKQLLSHPSEDVKIHAIKTIGKLQLKTLLEDLVSLLEQPGTLPAVREVCILELCSMSTAILPKVLPFLSASSPVEMRGAIIGLSRFGDREMTEKARQKLDGLMTSEDVAKLVLATSIVGALKKEEHHDFVLNMLQSENTKLVKAGIQAAASMGNACFAPHLIECIKKSVLYHEAMKALESTSEAALEQIKLEFGKANKSKARYLTKLCQVCGNIGGGDASSLLWWMLKYPWLELQAEAYNALKAAGYHADTKEKMYAVTEKLENVFRQAFWLYCAIDLLERKDDFHLLLNALQLQLNAEKRKASLLLGFLYTKDKVGLNFVFRALASVDKEERQRVQEFLFDKMPGSVAEKLMILLGNISQRKKVALFSRFYSNSLMDEITVVMKILQDSHRENLFSRWTQATALYSLQKAFYPSMLKSLKPYILSGDPLLYQSALHTIRKFSKDRLYNIKELLSEILYEGELKRTMKKVNAQPDSLLEIEKVIILKSTSIFSETPESVLTDIAAILEEERVNAGQVVFRKGDIGNCMYIIYEGEVKIHIGDYRLNTLINRDFFGDLGLLDTNPRSASATAERDTLLLRLDQDDFYDLMAQRPEVAKGIVQVLCARIRVQDALIMDLQGKKVGTAEIS